MAFLIAAELLINSSHTILDMLSLFLFLDCLSNNWSASRRSGGAAAIRLASSIHWTSSQIATYERQPAPFLSEHADDFNLIAIHHYFPLTFGTFKFHVGLCCLCTKNKGRLCGLKLLTNDARIFDKVKLWGQQIFNQGHIGYYTNNKNPPQVKTPTNGMIRRLISPLLSQTIVGLYLKFPLSHMVSFITDFACLNSLATASS